MHKQQIAQALQNPNGLDEQSLDGLKLLLEEYPFFQAGRMLWVKNLHLLGHIRYNNELKLAAAHIADRAQLFALIHAPVREETKQVEQPRESQTPAPPESPMKPQSLESESADTELAPPGEKNPQSTPAVDDYLGASDEFELPSGGVLTFGAGAESDPDNIVLPSADFLGFDEGTVSEYRLEEEGKVPADEARSFSDWLKVLKQQPVLQREATADAPLPEPVQKKRSLIDDFLEGGRKRRRLPSGPSATTENVDISAASLQERDDLMTETLAGIYIKQGHFSKAMDIFDRLRLKYPEKSVYFARRIKALEEDINNSNK
ncbi:hypothetical protein [Geofilum rhodophaeum]|uniref:hypothetical protein n=1 Tax=Geofilum rhodophaeum TaxID=1965019 RepID=UPI000B5256B2|nr:hypothetical protein [Geofilum rhodophaeum]